MSGPRTQAAREACAYLKAARAALVRAGSPRAADKVRAALKSAEGAVRHAERMDAETPPPAA